MNDYSRFYKIYTNLPEKLRDGIIVVINKKPYTWNSAYVEMQNETHLGQAIYEN